MAEELEFLVHFNRTLCLSLSSDDVSLSAITRVIQQREGVPADRLELLVDGERLHDDDELPMAPRIIRARMTDGLLGGKGGFGAMLRSMGKGSAGKATTNFGACRDLHGRRLRHVNQEVQMQKWREESELREQRAKAGVTAQEMMDDETPSGIPGWYLAVPSWAEGIKKSYMKRRRNTTLCRHWVQARSDGRTPPPNAPRWWGCPRGRDCDFAHGEDELRGEALTELKKQKKVEHQQKQQQELDRYVNYEKDMRGDIHDAIREGMRKRKAKATKSVEAAVPAVVPLPEPVANDTVSDSHASDWLAAVDAGSVSVMFRHGLCELRGAGNFGTATSAAGCKLASGKWQYEVKLITNGVIQLGWADAAFAASSNAGDGVGDHASSWAYDGCRQLKWTGGADEEYGVGWERGDIISCLLDLEQGGTIRFARNGELMDVAFSGVAAGSPRGFFPAISVEQGEILLVNVGAQPLLYPVEGFTPVMEAMRLPDKSKSTGPDEKTRQVEKKQEPPAQQDGTPASVEATQTKKEELKPVTPKREFPPLDLDKFSSTAELEALGLDALKAELQRRKLKCGYVQAHVG
ncbi:hypothetical protein ATCC90586_002846 [Pythium insidiosum]|nr:hypothetical protein ATCC90586_002846 [Pythium insidiosum]